jgi:hypothetical protein
MIEHHNSRVTRNLVRKLTPAQTYYDNIDKWAAILERNRRIYRLRQEGRTMEYIADVNGVTKTTIKNVVDKADRVMRMAGYYPWTKKPLYFREDLPPWLEYVEWGEGLPGMEEQRARVVAVIRGRFQFMTLTDIAKHHRCTVTRILQTLAKAVRMANHPTRRLPAIERYEQAHLAMMAELAQ